MVNSVAGKALRCPIAGTGMELPDNRVMLATPAKCALARRQNCADISLLVFNGSGIGGCTTFWLDAVTRWERGETGAAIAHVGASVILSLVALFGVMLACRHLI